MTKKQLILYVISIKIILAFYRLGVLLQQKKILMININEVRQCLQKLNPRKAIGQDKIPLSTPFSITINISFKYNIFPSNAKVACVKPLDKKTEDKHCISNFRPVSILNTFSKIYEMFAKKLLVSNIEEFFSPFLVAYRKFYNTQYVLIRMVEEWK